MVDACIVTVSVGVLAAGSIAFKPALPAIYTKALKALRMGSYKKIAVELAHMPPEIQENTNYYLYNDGNNNTPEEMWQFYRHSDYPKNVLIAHMSGDFAEQLDAMPDSDVYRAFKAALTEAYEDTTIALRSTKIATNWNADPLVAGAYSYTA
ncbi:FAD-dependent oxidoreductase [Colwellia sp. MB02u-14]|uniref:FAD-dependent oxidoreductase n=1 Tax=Colwellia sp. MB02u-14 TaxID=2759815 RepID=UPI0015F3FAEB|nr:FAD-dependent oxidoreductase [Colwellia sp. MB02u-14]MBA6304212.1 FAD-dependent oxidoreductase [Colwellia sp. MB02u-14]